MDEKALQEAFRLFSSEGYNGNINDFKSLISSNPEALQESFRLFSSQGYNRSINDYKALIGVSGESDLKKKDTVSPTKDGSLDSPKIESKIEELVVDPYDKGLTDIQIMKSVEGLQSLDGYKSKAANQKQFDRANELISMYQRQNESGKTAKQIQDQRIKEDIAARSKEIPSFGMPMPSKEPTQEENLIGDRAIVKKHLGEFRPYIKEKPKANELLPEATFEQDLENRLRLTTDKLIGKEEEYVVPELNYQFKEHGFKFEETGKGDAMKVSAPNGQEMVLDLDPFTSKGEGFETGKLKAFISANSIDYSKINKVAKQKSEYDKRFINENEINISNSRMANDIKSFEYELQQLGLIINKETPEYTKKANEVALAQKKLEANQSELKNSIGEYEAHKAEQGTFMGAVRNALITAPTEIVSGLSGVAINAIMSTNPLISDKAVKDLRKSVQSSIRGSLDYFKDDTTEEFVQDLPFFPKAIVGAIHSLPALLTAEFAPFLIGGMINDDLDKEMDNNPAFDNVPELERYSVKGPIIAGGALLETFGFRNVIASKGLLNGIVYNAIGKSTKNTTTKSFKEFINQEIENRIAKGSLVMIGGALAEAETGASQELLDITTKEIYNAIKEKEMFQTPDSFVEGFKQVLEAGAAEAIGGLILGAPTAINTAYKKNDFSKVSNADIEILDATSKDATINNSIALDLQMKVNSGELTPEEAKEQLDGFRESAGLMNSINTEGMSPSQKKRALTIAKKLQVIKQRTEGKVNITESDKTEESELKAELNTITEDARAPKEEVKEELVTEFIDKRVVLDGQKGTIRQDEGGKLTFNTPDTIIELTGEEKASLVPLANVELNGKKVKIEGENFDLLSINQKDGETVSVTLRNDKGQVITKQDPDLANQISQLKQPKDAIQKQSTDEGLLRTEQPEVGLQEVVTGDKGLEVATTGVQAIKSDQEIAKDEVLARKQAEIDQLDAFIPPDATGVKLELREKALAKINTKYDAELDALPKGDKQILPELPTEKDIDYFTPLSEEEYDRQIDNLVTSGHLKKGQAKAFKQVWKPMLRGISKVTGVPLQKILDNTLAGIKVGKEKDAKGDVRFQTRDGKQIGFVYDTDKTARERFDISKLTKIGSGSDRDVYDLGNGKVLKVAKTARGLTQNIYEGDYYLTSVVPEVTERGLNYVVAENTPRIKTSDVVTIYDWDGNEIGKSTAGEMLKELRNFSQRDIDNKNNKLMDTLAKYGLQDIESYEVLWNDFTAQRNWGYKDGRAYHSDGGTFGGVDMIDSHKGKTNMSDPEFRKIYEESKRLKRQFGDTDKSTMYQQTRDTKKGAIQKLSDIGKSLILFFEKGDISTAIHEHGHLIKDIFDWASANAPDYQSKVEIQKLHDVMNEFVGSNGKNSWTAEQHEKFARALEKYFATGDAPTSALKSVFEKIKGWLIDIYKDLKVLDVEISPEIKRFFDKLIIEGEGAKAKVVKKPKEPTDTSQLDLLEGAELLERPLEIPIGAPKKKAEEKPKENLIEKALEHIKSGKINSDDAAIKLDENGIDVTNEIYDDLRKAEKEYIVEKSGIQIGHVVTIKGKNSNPDFEGNFRGLTKDGKAVVVVNGLQGTYELDDIIDTDTKTTKEIGTKNYKEGKNQLLGRKRTKTIPNGERVSGQYKIVSSDDILASHNEETFSQTKGFPVREDGTTPNDRDYEKVKTSQAEVIKISKELDDRAVYDTPAVSKDGIVLDGNNRTMSRKLAAKNKIDGEYLAALKESAEQFGFDPEQIGTIKDPILVFELETEMPYTTETFKKFNVSEKKEKSPIDKAIEVSKTITNAIRESLFLIFKDSANMSEVTGSSAKVKEMIKLFLDNGVLQSNEIPRYFDAEKFITTSEGVSFLESLMMGSALNEKSIRALGIEGNGDIKNKILASIVALVKNSSMGKDSLLADIERAIEIIQEARKSNQALENYVAQEDLLVSKDITLEEFAMAYVLESGSLKQFINSYNETAGKHDIFTGKATSKREIIERYVRQHATKNTALITNLILNESKRLEGDSKSSKEKLPKIEVNEPQKPSEVVTEKETSEAKDLASRIRSKKLSGLGIHLDLGISKTIYNMALEIAAKEVEKGTKLGIAIAKAIKWIDSKVNTKWNKAEFARHLTDRFKVTVNGKETEVQRDDTKETAELINGFYSPLEQGILDVKVERATGKEWKKKLQGTTESDEIKWTGIGEFLDENSDKSLTKKEVQQFLKDNRIEIAEVIKEDKIVSVKDTVDRIISIDSEMEEIRLQLRAFGYSLESDMGGEGDILIDKDGEVADYDELPNNIATLYDDYGDLWSEKESLRTQDEVIKETTYGQYQLKGEKENYKEVLITIPTQRKKVKVINKDGKWKLLHSDGSLSFASYITKEWAEKALKEYIAAEESGERKDISTFKSGHWRESNILTHLRMNTRTDAEGKKVLFIEEAQSDWGQQGKREGFKSGELDKLTDEEVINKLGGKIREDGIGGFNAIYPDRSVINYRKRENAVESLAGDLRKKDGQPTAPFVTDTNSWTKLALKVALKEAVKQGADKIAWTTGEQQNERYDLSKQVDSISYKESTGGTRYVDISVPDRLYTYKVDADGKIIEALNAATHAEVGKNLSDVIGKDITEKILSSKDDGRLEGEGLKIGGKGMVGFYGDPKEGKLGIIGGVAESLLGEVGTTKIGSETQHSIEITPEIKESIESGIPLFKGLTPDGQIQRGVDKLKKLVSGKQLYDITTIPAAIIEALTDIAVGYARKGDSALKDFIKHMRDDFGDYFKNVSDQEIKEHIFDKVSGDAKPLPKKGKTDIKKTIATVRAYEGDIRKNVKKELEKLGLTRDIENQELAKSKAIEFIENVGKEMALEAVRNNDVSDAAGAYVWNELIERVDRMISLEKNPEEIIKLEKIQAQLFNEFSRKALSGGRFSSALNDIFQSSDLGYNVEKKIQEFKDANDGVISKEIEDKFRELNNKYREVKVKLAEAEERVKRESERLIINNITEYIEREQKQEKTSTAIRRTTDWVVSKIKGAKLHKPSMFSSATPASIVWDGAVEIIATTIKLTGRGAEAIAKGLEYIKNSNWYKSLSDSDKKEAEKQFFEFWNPKQKLEITDNGIKIPQGLIRQLVEGGADTIEKLTEEVKQIIEEDYPGITDREIRDTITEYGRIKNLNKDEISKEIRKIKRIGRILSALEDVNEKKRPLRSGIQRDKLDAQERALNKELREAMKGLPIDAVLQAEQQKTVIDAAKSRIRNQIEDLQLEIDRMQLVPRNAKSINEDAELIDLKEKRDALKVQHEEIFKGEAFKHAKRLESAKKAAKNRIEYLQQRIKSGDFSKKTKSPLIEDSELISLRAEKLRLQEEYDKEIFKAKLNNRSKSQKLIDYVWDAWGLLRLLRATGEFSFVGIQGLIQTIAHPLYAVKAFKTSMKFFASEKKTEEWLREIKSQEWYGELKQSKLALTEPHAEVSAREELFYSDSANLIWNIIGSAFRLKSKDAYTKWQKMSPFKAFERAAVGYLDTLRVLRFLDGKEMLNEKGITFANNPQAFKEMADVINTFTGRASIGSFEHIAPTLTKIFFSPRNWASAIKTATPYAFIHFGKKRAGAKAWMPSVAQKMAIADFSKFLGLTTSIVALAALYYDDDDEDGVETDPTSSDFAKIKIGDTRIDPWGGRIQQIVLMSRLILGSIKKGNNEIVPLGTPFKTPTKKELLIEMATNKLMPSAGILERYLSAHEKEGELVTKYGKPYSFSEDLTENLYPIYWGTASDLIKDDPTALDGLLLFYSFFGGGVSVYDKATKEKQNESPYKRYLKEHFPEQYNKQYGKESPRYKQEQILKERKKKIKKMQEHYQN